MIMSDNTNLFIISESTINGTKKPSLAHKIVVTKRKTIMGLEISSRCYLMPKPNETIS